MATLQLWQWRVVSNGALQVSENPGVLGVVVTTGDGAAIKVEPLRFTSVPGSKTGPETWVTVNDDLVYGHRPPDNELASHGRR